VLRLLVGKAGKIGGEGRGRKFPLGGVVDHGLGAPLGGGPRAKNVPFATKKMAPTPQVMNHTCSVRACLWATLNQVEFVGVTLSASFLAMATYLESRYTRDMLLCRWIERGVQTKPSTMRTTKSSMGAGFVSLR